MDKEKQQNITPKLELVGFPILTIITISMALICANTYLCCKMLYRRR